MSKPKESMDKIVSSINQRFENLNSLSNDGLRHLVSEIRSDIRNSSNVNSQIERHLIDIFAIVKETARRFSQGKIVVTANQYDKQLAETYDFITIKGDQAIYRNRWDAAGVPFVWNMVHYDEQILGGINLHYGKAVEMATGEGKTLVTTLPVFLNALSGKGVHIMTVNDYLSKRDYQIPRPLYLFYGFTVGCIEEYRRQEYGRKVAYDSDITFGANSSFVFDYLFDHLAVDPKDCLQRGHNYAIIDEIDSILIDEADTPHIVSGGTQFYDGDSYKEYLPIIQELLASDEDGLYNYKKINKAASFTEKGKKWLVDKLSIADLFKYDKLYEVSAFDSFSADEQKQILHTLKVQNVLNQLLHALTVYEKDVDYVVASGDVKIIDQNTGRIKPTSRWEHGLHTAIEVKEAVTIRPDSDGMAVISLKNYFKLYNKVSGMSGSITPVSMELSDIYGLSSANIPTHLPVIRHDYPLQIFKTKQAKDDAIIQEIISNWKSGRPTLIGTLSLKRADEIGHLVEDSNLPFNRLDARTTKDEAITVAKAGIGHTITLSTSVAGRGTDIKPSEDVLLKGGLSVIGADLFGSVRTDLQLRGRAGRQGNPGSSKFYASLDDDILQYLSETEREELKAFVENIESNDISTEDVRHFFELAQIRREDILRDRRKETAYKDDIIAPYRAKFYEQRNKALFDIEYACQEADEIITKADCDGVEKVDAHITTLYSSTKELVLRSKRNNSNRTKIFVPYSTNQNPFAILFDIDLLLTSPEYLLKEFKRQNLLQIYDKFWKEFVIYLMQNLDRSEIDGLSDKYIKMMEVIESEICERLTNASPAFHVETREKLSAEVSKDQSIDNIQKQHISKSLDRADLCPCGSGLLYCNCHGASNKQHPRRRR